MFLIDSETMRLQSIAVRKIFQHFQKIAKNLNTVRPSNQAQAVMLITYRNRPV